MDYMKDIREISDEQAVILWQASRLSLSGKYEKAPEILSVKGSVIGTLGNFSASIGKAKSKKTFNVSAIVAAALKNGTVLRYAAELPEAKRKVLYVDTEQSPHHCLNVMERIMRMAGLPDDRDNENLEFLALRKYTPEQRIRIVEQAIYHTPNLGLVIIDGIRDMVYDINSPSESTRIISKLMQWTDDRQIHILSLIHIFTDRNIKVFVRHDNSIKNLSTIFLKSQVNLMCQYRVASHYLPCILNRDRINITAHKCPSIFCVPYNRINTICTYPNIQTSTFRFLFVRIFLLCLQIFRYPIRLNKIGNIMNIIRSSGNGWTQVLFRYIPVPNAIITD